MGRRGGREGGGRLATLFWVAMQRRVFILFMFDFFKTASLNGPDVFCNMECLYIYLSFVMFLALGRFVNCARSVPSLFFYFFILLIFF